MDELIKMYCKICWDYAVLLHQMNPAHELIRYYVIKTEEVEDEFFMRFCFMVRDKEKPLPQLKRLQFFQRFSAAIETQIVMEKLTKKSIK